MPRADCLSMRNLFDQYKHAENRLTHSLACSLNEDRPLLRDFLAWLKIKPSVSPAKLLIIAQRLPGDPLDIEDEPEMSDRRGLPDIVIHDQDHSWCLFVENKVNAPFDSDQLRRHAQ